LTDGINSTAVNAILENYYTQEQITTLLNTKLNATKMEGGIVTIKQKQMRFSI
jgi:hypothetical protein